MFTVIKTVYKKPKGINKVFSKKPTSFLKKINIENSYYYELTVHYQNKNIKWKKIFNSVNVTDVPVIMPKAYQTAQINIKKYCPASFGGIIYANCAKKLFPNKSKAFVIDNSFDNSHMLYSLLEFFKEVNIFTEDQQKYAELISRSENELGVTPIFCESVNSVQNADFIINLQGVECEAKNDNVLGLGGYMFAQTDLRLPKNIVRLMPRNINPFLFSSALYELCGVNVLKDCTAIKLQNNLNGKIIKVQNK